MKIHLTGDMVCLGGDWKDTEMSCTNIDTLTSLLDQIQTGGKKKLIINCAHLDTIDDSGARFLDIWLQCLKLRGIDHEMINIAEHQKEFLLGTVKSQVENLQQLVRKSLSAPRNTGRKSNETQRNQGNRQAAPY